MSAPNQTSILKAMKLLEQILLMFYEKHDEEVWHGRKLELLFAPVNDGPSIFASMM